ncbi:hypothetical protein D3C80_994880 [compost metagenome]
MHQTFLGGAQVAGALIDQALQFFAAALAQAGQAPALVEKQYQEHQAQPHGRRCQGGMATVFGSHQRAAQQVQGPAIGWQRQRLPEIVRRKRRPLHADQAAVVADVGQYLVLQRGQRLFVILPGGGQLGAIVGRQGLQLAVAPARLVGDEDDATGITDQQDIAALLPFAFQFREFELDHHRAEECTVRVGHRTGKKVAGYAAGDAYGVEAPGALALGLLEIGAKTVILAHVAAGRAPVAGCHRQAGAIEQLQGRGIGCAIDAFELVVQGILGGRIDRPGQGVDQFRIQRQHGRQGTVAFDQGVQGVGVQAQLHIGPCGILDQRPLLGLAHRPAGREQGAGEDQQNDEGQAQGTGGDMHVYGPL